MIKDIKTIDVDGIEAIANLIKIKKSLIHSMQFIQTKLKNKTHKLEVRLVKDDNAEDSDFDYVAMHDNNQVIDALSMRAEWIVDSVYDLAISRLDDEITSTYKEFLNAAIENNQTSK